VSSTRQKLDRDPASVPSTAMPYVMIITPAHLAGFGDRHHVAVADGGQGDDSPPEGVADGDELGVDRVFGVVGDQGADHHDADGDDGHPGESCEEPARPSAGHHQAGQADQAEQDHELARGLQAGDEEPGGRGRYHEQGRWYVTPLFTAFLVLTLRLYSDATTASEQWRFNGRVGETLLGVGFAYLYRLVLPQIIEALRPRRNPSHNIPLLVRSRSCASESRTCPRI
jgi:hypothetical protein